MASKDLPQVVIPPPPPPRLRKNTSTLYVDAGTGNTKVIGYRASFWDNANWVQDPETCFKSEEVAMLDPIQGNSELEVLACRLLKTYYRSFTDKVVLGATEWRRKQKPTDPLVDDFCDELAEGGVTIVPINTEDEAMYEATAVQFALARYSCSSPAIDGTFYVSAGGGSLQCGFLDDATSFRSFPIKVKEFSDILWAQYQKDSYVNTQDFQDHFSSMHDIFSKLPKVTDGVVVCMGSLFYSAKEIKMANAPTEFTTHSIDDVLDKMLNMLKFYISYMGPSSTIVTKKFMRAYVALQLNYTFLEAVVRAPARVLFKRDWQIGDDTFRTTWTFGHFLRSLE